LPLRVTRDLFTGDFERLLVDNDRAHKRIVGYLKKTSPHMVERVVRYKDRPTLMEGLRCRAGDPLDAQTVASIFPRAAYLIFDLRRGVHGDRRQHPAALSARVSKTSGRTARGHDHEEQPSKAVKEVVRQAAAP